MLLSLNDNCITLTGLLDKTTGTLISDATVGATLAIGGVNVTGETWPLTLAAVGATPGTYRAILQSTIGISPGDTVNANVDVTTTGGGNANFNGDVEVETRPLSG